MNAPSSIRTAAILAADAANYSRAMSSDEPRALAALAASRAVIDAAIAGKGGRIFSTGGDSVLAEFPETASAVACAVEAQQALARAKAAGVETLPYRMGLHVGHVYPNGADLLGETVNIAARLEGLAYPGGVCLSDRALAAFEPDPALAIEPIGAQTLKGIRHPMRVARIRLGESEPASEEPRRLSLAVLRFRAPGENSHWGEGLAEDLIAALSRFSTLGVLSRASSFAFDPDQEPREVAAALGVSFVVTGAARVSPSRLRLQATLVDCASGKVMWAERYDRDANDILDVQDELVEKIVATLAGRLQQSEAEAALRRRPENLGAFDLLMRGIHHSDRLDAASAAAAIECFERALALSPDYPSAMAMLALMRLRDWALHPGERDIADVARLAERALALDPADSWCRLVAGQIDMYRGRLDTAEVHHKKAYALNPYDARILALWSPLATYLGKPEEGRRRIEKAMELNPRHPAWYATNLGLACYCSGAYADGAAAYGAVADPQVGVLAGLAACRAQLGDADGAAQARASLLALAPNFRAGVFVGSRPFRFAEDSQRLLDGLRAAGLPA